MTLSLLGDQLGTSAWVPNVRWISSGLLSAGEGYDKDTEIGKGALVGFAEEVGDPVPCLARDLGEKVIARGGQ